MSLALKAFGALVAGIVSGASTVLIGEFLGSALRAIGG